MVIEVISQINTNSILDVLPLLYNKEYHYPGGKITLLPNNNIATNWYGYKFVYDSTSGEINTQLNEILQINKDFIPEQYFDKYYDEKCDLLDYDQTTIKLDTIKILLVTEYSNNMNDKMLRKLLHHLVGYYNSNVY